MNSIWLEHPKYPGYRVSPEGNILSLKTDKILAKKPMKNGYILVKMNGKNRLLHRVVAGVFCPGESPVKQVNHKNGNKKDNTVDNLEWVSAKENVRHSFDVLNRKAPSGEDHSRAKLTNAEVAEIISLRYEKKISTKKLSVIFGVSRAHISALCNGTKRKCFERKIKTTSKLNSLDVEEIRIMADPEKRNYSAVAKKFGISKAMVCLIKKNRTRING